MARVFIPTNLRSLTQGLEQLEVSGSSVRAVIDQLESAHPGVREKLCDAEGNLRPGVSAVINGSVAALGALQRVDPDAEIHFLPSIGGG
jgi:molybdopterin synthase sulfur carrier subunit